VDFDLNLMAAGLSLLLIHTSILAVVAAVPRNRLVSGIISER
jgi:hypothetical protein